MTARRSSAPVQTDPIRERLGKTSVVRDVVCPNCGVLHATSRRWQLRCPECNHIWIDRSSHRLTDKLRDMRLPVFTALWLAFAALSMLGGFAAFVAGLFAEAFDKWGWDHTYGLAALFVASVISLFVLGRLFQRD